MMDLRKRELAPITPEAWVALDAEARRVLRLQLAGRKIVDFSGPHGWEFGAVNTGRLETIVKGSASQVAHAIREVLPLVELRVGMTLPILELDYAARGATDLDLDPVIAAAEEIALAEDVAIFHGFKDAKITGIVEASPHAPIEVNAMLEWPRAVVAAREVLRAAGVDGPYALAVGVDAHAELTRESEEGYPLRKRIEESLSDVSLIRTPALRDGGALVSTRGGDYELTVGQDFSLGYAFHDRTHVELFLTESFTFRILERKASVFLSRPQVDRVLSTPQPAA